MYLSPVPPRPQAQLVISPDRPAYRVVGKRGFFGPDDVLYEQGSAIYLDSEPTLDLEPLNDMALQAKREFLQKLDDEGKKVSALTGKSYRSYSDAFENARALATKEAKQVEVVGYNEQVPLMGAKKRGRPKVEKVSTGAELSAEGTQGSLSIGNPKTGKENKGKGLL